MTKSKNISYILIFFLLLCVTATECLGSDKQASEIKGKFVFDSNRFELSDVFVTENGKTNLLIKKAAYPAWSSDGKMIACSGSDGSPKKYGIWILDSKGNKKEFVETRAGIPSELSWSPDGTKIYYRPFAIPWRESGSRNKIYCYDILAKTHTKIVELDEKFTISNMKLSPKGDKLIIESSYKRDFPIYLSNSDGTNLRIIGRYKGDCSWYPDNEHILYLSNVADDGQMYITMKEGLFKDAWGYFFKMNVNTGEIEKLWLCKTPFLMNLKISRDGKYFYYIAAAQGGGRAVYVSPIDNPDKKIQITQSVFLTPATYGRSQDDNPDWYQD